MTLGWISLLKLGWKRPLEIIHSAHNQLEQITRLKLLRGFVVGCFFFGQKKVYFLTGGLVEK